MRNAKMIDIIIDDADRAGSDEVDDPLPAAEDIRGAVEAAALKQDFLISPRSVSVFQMMRLLKS